jgi:hypothetical protein
VLPLICRCQYILIFALLIKGDESLEYCRIVVIRPRGAGRACTQGLTLLTDWMDSMSWSAIIPPERPIRLFLSRARKRVLVMQSTIGRMRVHRDEIVVRILLEPVSMQ